MVHLLINLESRHSLTTVHMYRWDILLIKNQHNSLQHVFRSGGENSPE